MVDAVAQTSEGTEINRASINIQAGGFPHGNVGMSESSTGVPVDKGLVSYILQGYVNCSLTDFYRSLFCNKGRRTDWVPRFPDKDWSS